MAAAEELFVTPSAISHQLKSLEAFLGLELFIRQTRRIVLTHAGKEYYQSVQRALLEIDRATQKLVSKHQSGELHLSVTPAFLTRWLLPRMNSFHEANPDITLEISSTTGLIDFKTANTDMAVYFGDGNWPGIEIHFLRNYRQVPVCSPNLLKSGSIHQPEDLLKHTLLYVSKRRDEWTKWFQQVDTPFKETKQGVYFSSGALTTSAAISGLGIALADIGFISEEMIAGQLIVPIEICLETNKAFYLVYQKNRVMTYAMKTFQDWLMEAMAKDIGSSDNA